jgi:hypothetical protein
VHDLTLAERAGVQIAVDFVKFARERPIPGLAACYLSHIGYQVAVRDSRRIVGEYVVTREDAESGHDFEDAVARKYGGLDDVGRFMVERKSGFGSLPCDASFGSKQAPGGGPLLLGDSRRVCRRTKHGQHDGDWSRGRHGRRAERKKQRALKGS